MPMLYGEGDNAFVRLQEEILRLSDDHSLLAWGLGLPPTYYGSRLLAQSPDDFSKCGSISRSDTNDSHHYTMTNKGLQIRPRMTAMFEPSESFLALLNCGNARQGPCEASRVALPLRSSTSYGCHFRDPNRVPKLLPPGYNVQEIFEGAELATTYLAREMRYLPLLLDYGSPFSLGCEDFDIVGGITDVYPEVWTPALKEGWQADVFKHRSLRGTILFLYSGGGLRRFIAKICVSNRSGIAALSCEVTWISDEATSLAGLVLLGLRLEKAVGLKNIPWYHVLDDLEEINWQTDLDSDDGTRLSVRVIEDATGKVVIKFRTASESKASSIPSALQGGGRASKGARTGEPKSWIPRRKGARIPRG